MKNLLTILFAVCLIGSGCKKEDFENAPFRCKINGKEFISTTKATCTLSGTNNYYIQATRLANPLNDDLYGEIKFDIYVDSLGAISLDLQNTWRWSNNGTDTYRASGSDPGTLIVTSFDPAAKRMTATFELTAYNDAQTDTKSVTEGFLDVSW